MSSAQHLAAVLTAVGSPLEVQERPTPTPGPAELLIEVKSIALNPVDYMQRETGCHISHKPAILGSDVAGVIVASGSAVANPLLRPGARVGAFAAAFWKEGLPDYGGMPQRVIVPAAHAVVLPDSINFNEGALLPMSVATAWIDWYRIGLPLDASFVLRVRKSSPSCLVAMLSCRNFVLLANQRTENQCSSLRLVLSSVQPRWV
ncbi:chaperonin 10-like protein [Phyllosticta citrichinensis]|uniref:Chaperonin 10-like protein n=1 Tax=Phyllosticta citrichinensis TaxID=1130410 RepID=A0ABR1XL14_9PEZI